MIVDAKPKAQGVKRDGCKVSQIDSLYNFFPTTNVLLVINKIWVVTKKLWISIFCKLESFLTGYYVSMTLVFSTQLI